SLLMTQIAVLRVETSKPAKQSIPGLPRPPGERDGARESTGGVGASLDDGRRSVRTGARGHCTLLLFFWPIRRSKNRGRRARRKTKRSQRRDRPRSPS